MTPKKKLAPVHPGEILREEFMQPLGLSQTWLGRDLGVSPRRINEIVHGKRSITADTALRLIPSCDQRSKSGWGSVGAHLCSRPHHKADTWVRPYIKINYLFDGNLV
jgi:addiction module HigA family antidote